MTVLQTINRFDLLYPNALTQEQKRTMLSELDGRYFSEVLSRYQGEQSTFAGYNDASANTQTLLIHFPYDELYIQYLVTQNDLINGDIARYNNSASVFNASYADYVNRFHRGHTLISENKISV